MKVSVSEIEKRQVILEIEVEPERVQKALDQAYRRAADRVNVPGFRRGKAPRPLVERMVGHDRLLEEALERLLPQVYDEAIAQQDIKPISRPKFEVTSTEPLQFKATVGIEPRVVLGDYRSIRRERPATEPTDDEVEAVIQHLRETHGEWVPVERPVQLGDRVSLDVKAQAEGRTILDSKDAETIVDPERPQPAPGFAEALVGMQPGETREFTLRLPEDYEDKGIAGEELHFTVTLHGVKERRLPELDDEFARTVSDEYQDVAALREAVRKQIAESKAANAERDYENAVVSEAVQQSTVEIPPQMVERQADFALRQFAHSLDRQGINVEQYLRFTNRTPEAFRDELLADAEQVLARSLVLDAIADAEGITISDEDVDAEIQRMTADSGNRARAAEASQETRDRVRAALRQREAVRRLVSIAAGSGEQAQATA